MYQQPFEVTLRSFIALEDMERIDKLLDRGKRIDMAFMVNAAFAGGEKGKRHPLERINSAFAAELRRDPWAPEKGELTERERDVLAGIFAALAKQRTPEPVS